MLDHKYWNDRYEASNTGWDLGHISLPLKTFFTTLTNKNLKILIPGGGNSYEAQWLWEHGFTNVHVIDIAKYPLEQLKRRVTHVPETHIHHEDFFNHEGSYDLIIEQTFFCALSPILRQNYVHKMHSLLTPAGRLVGLLFDFELKNEGPPYGGQVSEYIDLFKPKFNIHKLERATNSEKSRQGKELFFIFEKNKP